MKLWKAVLILLVFLLAIFASVKPIDLLYIFSQQAPIDPDKLTGEFDYSASTAVFNNQIIAAPLYSQDVIKETAILGETSGNKRIEVDLTNQRLYAYEGDQRVFEFAISSGTWGRTPTGNFKIWAKVRYTLMKGGSKELKTYYYLPNVPYVMFFYNEGTPRQKGYAIHGTYWHNNFGHPMSHGCINMRTEEAALLYEWASPSNNGKGSINATTENPGTEIIIYGKAPPT